MHFSTIVKLALAVVAVAQVGTVLATPAALEARQAECVVNLCDTTADCPTGLTCVTATIELPLPLPPLPLNTVFQVCAATDVCPISGL
ncbi:hypothetical protein BD414DRAFT_496496 [Trametes punicea]|nr:hypothetical protein BD414DRAFT_496496 [Trametes punicea]